MHDIGMARMISGKKDCIGKDASMRPGLLANREELVGIKPVDPAQKIDAGAHVFNPGDAITRANDQGYLTSVAYSPTLKSYLALGFVLDGHARHGDRLLLVDHLRGVRTEVELCHPVFFDPEGARARG